jgi:pimeloyl-ACP methyl ester carboxylesterase
MSTAPTMFRSEEGQARYFAAYEATLGLWPVAVEPVMVESGFGPTHVNVCGPADGPPLLLLPGQAISSTMWYPNIGALSEAYRVYAVDILGDMGKSVRTRPFKKPVEFGEWMNDVLDGLHIERAYVAGLSYGGFIALRLALAAPERVRKLVLMAPASLLRLRLTMFLRMMAMVLPASVLPLESKQRILLGAGSATTTPAIKQMMTSTDFRYNMYLPPVCSDEELGQLKMPTLLLFGEQEVIYNYQAALKRATKLIPQVETAVIPGAGHGLNFDRPEVVNECILEFLGRVEG